MALGYEIIGNGHERVLVLPDWFGGSAFLKSLGELVDGDSFTYAVADYRGYGRSREQRGKYTIQEMAADALCLADELRWKQFHLVGHSMSGKVVLLLAATASDRIKSAIAMTPASPTAVPLDDGTRQLLEGCQISRESRITALDAATGSRYGKAFISRLADISMAASRPEAYRAYLDAWSKTDITPDLRDANVPLKVMVGANDPFVQESVVRDTVIRAFPRADLCVLQNVGHYPVLEAPPLTIALWESWFNSVDDKNVSN